MIDSLKEIHLDDVARLEALCFANPWSKVSLTHLLHNGNFGAVALDRNTVVAYGGVVVALDEGEIANIATHPDHRRNGYGQAVLEALLRKARESNLVRLTLEVRASNLAAQRLYKKLGFSVCGLRKGFYTAPREDALVMDICLQ